MPGQALCLVTMSTIFKLSIQGIRSFDNVDRQTIQFGSPLTLIAGQNGTGKTTIIECLRYVTTGDLPPNSKGGAFIHDAKFTGDKEVLAQVKLAFYNINKVQMVCTRSLQLQMKRTQRSVKTLEGQLLAIKDGQRTTLNTRCADLDREMPIYLGTSRAILDYVVFCHQEESLWPLAEPSVVKKRFDEIFEATKFTKALENLRNLRKEYAQTIQLKEKDVFHIKVDKERAEKSESRIKVLQESRTNLEKRLQDTKSELGQLTARSKELFETNQKFQAVLYRLQSTQKELKHNEDSLKRITDGLELSDDSEETLESKLETHNQTTGELADRRDQSLSKLHDKKEKLKSFQFKYTENAQQLGQLQTEQDMHDSNLDKRAKFVNESVKALEIDDGSMDVNSFGTHLSNLKDLALRDIAAVKAARSREERSGSENLQNLRAQHLSKVERKKSANQERQACQLEKQALEDELAVSPVDEGMIAEERTNLSQLTTQLEIVRKQLAEGRVVELQRSLSQELERLETKVEELNGELADATKLGDDWTRLRILKEDSARKQAALAALVEAHRAEFREAAIDMDTDESGDADIESKWRIVYNKSQEAVDSEVHSLDLKRRKKSQTETRLKILRDEISRQQELILEKKQQLSSTLDSSCLSNISEEIERVERDVAELTADIGTAQFTDRYYSKALEVAQNADAAEQKCLLCDRNFQNQGEIAEFISRVRVNTEQLPSRLSQLEEDLAENTEYLSRLRRASPIMNALKESESSFPALVAEEKQLQDLLLTNNKSVEKGDEALALAKTQVLQIEKLRKVSSDIIRARRELANLSDQQLKLDSSLANSHTRQVDDIYEELGKIRQAIRQKKQELKKVTDDKNSLISEQSKLDHAVTDKRLHVNKLEYTMKEKSRKEERIELLRQKVTELDGEAGDIDRVTDALEAQINKAEGLLQEIQDRLENEEKRLMTKADSLSSMISNYNSLDTSIQQFLTTNGPGRLQQAKGAQSALESEIQQIESQVQHLETAANDAEKALLDVRGQERHLKDNLEVRRLEREIAGNRQLITSLETSNATHDKEQYETQAAQLSDELASRNSEYSSMAGEIKQINDQIAELQQELNTDFLNVKEEYARNLISYHSTIVANNDLAKYSQALDSAIMKYHALKMEEINRIVDELWKKTYTGSDIDSIVIRSEHESTKANRIYNYRVCMIKQDVELDMRGRCSAGQKVLASLIVRLALSECFGTKCGLIALDEPTTNLDKQNSESLAQSLSAIIASRRQQENFQLIVITHDQHFLSCMNASQITDHYFRVSRNSNQKSQIQCVPT